MHLAVFALNLAGFGLARPSQWIWRFQFKHETAAAPDRRCHLGVADDDDTGRSPTGGERDGQCQVEISLAGGARSGHRSIGGEVHQLHPSEPGLSIPNRKSPQPTRRHPVIALFGDALTRGTDAGWGRGPLAPGYPQPLSTMGMNYNRVVRGAHCSGSRRWSGSASLRFGRTPWMGDTRTSVPVLSTNDRPF
jgi:hypothetical protein